jgi:ATP-binding cassette subfamily B protein
VTKKRVGFGEIKDALRIYRFILPYKWQFILGLVCLVISTSVVAILPAGFRQLVDGANSKTMSTEMLKQLGFMLGGVLLVQAFFSYFRIYLFEIVSQRGMSDIRAKLYEKIITLPISFYENNRVGDLTSRITSDVSQLQESLSTNLAMFVRQLVLPIVCVPFLFTISVRLTCIMLITLPLMILSAVILGRFIRTLSRKSQDALAVANTIVEETFHAGDVVKAYTNEAYEKNRYTNSILHVVDISLYAAKYRAGFVSFIIVAMMGSLVLMVWQGLYMVSQNHISMGQLIEFIFFTAFIGGSLAGLSESYAVIQKTVGASERLNEILAEESEVNIADMDKNVTVKGAVAFDRVGFAYPTRKDMPVFNSLSFSVKEGEKIALVGPSGSGKSTIIKLISSFYKPDSGTIYIDDKPLNDYNITALRKNIGVVPQDTILFGGSIRDNIAYGKTNATEEEIRAAAQKANALQFIDSFPEGLNTLVGERGVKLSGGQKQRIAIARAILRDPKILILDEATSALDSESEKLVKDALNELMKGRTSFIIAHRLSTIREADTILVINKGKIVEQGTHTDLSSLNDGVYSKLLKLQYELE